MKIKSSENQIHLIAETEFEQQTINRLKNKSVTIKFDSWVPNGPIILEIKKEW